MQELGFEVFVPKVIPKTGFRSGCVSFDFDSSLSIPRRVLERLNRFDFYDSKWPPSIVRLVNRYFAVAFVMPHGQQLSEAVDKFAGHVVFRVFGAESPRTYSGVIQHLFGPDIHSRIAEIKDRFWFGECYNNLHEVESELFKERALFLPLAVPRPFFNHENQWRGGDKKILFVAPNVMSNPYYAKVYSDFKRDYGDLPHVMVGAQDIPVDDPHMLGFVTDEQLVNLFKDSAAYYYHSREPRHVHYTPFEAAIVGTPMVYMADSLLSRVCAESVEGRAKTTEEARENLKRLLEGDAAYIDLVRNDQRGIVRTLAQDHCLAVWRENLTRSGFLDRLQPPKVGEVVKTLLRDALPKWAKKILWPPLRFEIEPNADSFGEKYGSSLKEGIEFNQPLPEFVLSTAGLADQEWFGRWSDGPRVVLTLSHMLQGEFELSISATAYGWNKLLGFMVRIGDAESRVTFGTNYDQLETATLAFNVRKPTNVIEILIPKPTTPPNDPRKVGIALVEMRMIAPREAARPN